jgi:hypothetical protein
MSESILGSLFALAGVAAFAYAVAHWLVAASGHKVVWTVGALLLDVNVPLSQSHWRPSGELVPAWLALLAWLFRLIPLLIPPVRIWKSRANRQDQTHE